MTAIKVASISFCATDNKQQNVATALEFVKRAIDMGAQWIQLPEVFTFNGGSYDKMYEAAESLEGPTLTALQSLAQDNGVVIFAGSLAEKSSDLKEKKVYNTSCIIGRNGKIAATYRKLHLFNLYAKTGEKLYCESDGYLPGNDLVACDVDGFNVGMSICYDLRFPELYLEMQRRFGFLDVILVPAAFTLGTGMYHWETLLRTRAIEHQAYVIASNQVGTHAPGKSSYGHSMIIDPWGDVLASTGSEPGIAFAEFNMKRISDVRARVPSLQNKRTDLSARYDGNQ